MRLTKALVKPMFARAIATKRVNALNAAFKQHLGLDDMFAQVQSENSPGKLWKPVSFKAFECRLFSKTLAATDTRPEEPAINRVVHQVWPDGGQAEQQTLSGTSSSKLTAGKRKEAVVSESQQQEYKYRYLHLWRIFNTVMEQMRCRDPEREDLKDFGQNCRDLGARWCVLMPKNRCGALYLHTLMMHGGAFMAHLLPLELTIGMLENSGAERRHQIGKVHFRKSLAGGGKQYLGMASHENRTAFLTMRGVLIWQLGRDLLAQEIAKLAQLPQPLKESNRARAACGYAARLCSNMPSMVRHNHPVEDTQHQSGAMDLEERMEAVEQEDTEMDLDAELVAEQGDAIDEDGGFQVQNGPYIEQLDCRGDNDESSVDGSEDADSLLGGSDGGGNSEYENADVDD
jgi:uncharacterized membrane protein